MFDSNFKDYFKDWKLINYIHFLSPFCSYFIIEIIYYFENNKLIFNYKIYFTMMTFSFLLIPFVLIFGNLPIGNNERPTGKSFRSKGGIKFDEYEKIDTPIYLPKSKITWKILKLHSILGVICLAILIYNLCILL